MSLTKSKRLRRVSISPYLLREVRTRVGRLVPFAVGSPGSFATAVRRLSGIERFHVHQMWHTFACQWLERSGSLAASQRTLGREHLDGAEVREAGG